MNVASAIVLLAAAIVAGLTLIAAVAILVQRDPMPQTHTAGGWQVDLWNVADGSKIVLRFHQVIVVGRLSMYANTVSPYIPQIDGTISREQCMFYEENGTLLVWNMSMVNPTFINDQPLRQPTRLMPGNRIRMGYSTFLVTNVEYL